ncbi:MAG: hypothetical protein ABI923_09950 [bacterium]
MNRILLSLAMLIALTASALSVQDQSIGEREFSGTINNTLRVRMRLSQSGKILSGSYAYERVGKSLKLNGAMTSEKEFYLNEFDERGRQTGKFEGNFVSTDWLEGTWSSTSTKKEMPFSAWAIDGKQTPATDAQDRVSGQYRRVDKRGRFDRDSATLNVWLLKDGQVRVAGDSTWVGNEATGNVNVGNVDGVFALLSNKVFFKSGGGDDDCHFTIMFGEGSLLVTGDNLQCGGLNVSFDGKYRRVGPPKAE